MDTNRIDDVAKSIAGGNSRRGFIRALAALGVGGALLAPQLAEARTGSDGDCTVVTCPKGWAIGCTYDKDGVCLGCKCYKPTTGG